MTDKPDPEDKRGKDRGWFWWLEPVDAIFEAFRAIWLIMRALWWLVGLIVRAVPD